MKNDFKNRLNILEDNILDNDRVLVFMSGVIKFDDGIEYTKEDFFKKYPKYKDNYHIMVTFVK